MAVPLSLLFGLCFAVTIICALLGFSRSVFRQRSHDQGLHRNFDRLLCLYLAAYVPAVLASEYLVKLELEAIFKSYTSVTTINASILLWMSYASSAVVGTVISSYADRYGRCRFVLVFCIFNLLASILLHFDHFGALLIARIASGIAMSILFSCFEGWLVSECKTRAMHLSEILHILAFGQFSCGVFAFVGGAVDQVVTVDPYFELGKGVVEPLMWGGPLLSVDASIVVTMFVVVFVRCTWPENFGRLGDERDHWGHHTSLNAGAAVLGESFADWKRSKCTSTLFDGMQTMAKSRTMLKLATISSCSEGAFYIFFFSWSKYINAMAPQIQIDLMFAIIVLCFMIGSSICPLLTWPTMAGHGTIKLQLHFVLLTAAASLLPCVFTHNLPFVDLFGFMVFSLCAGIYVPVLSVYKCSLVPDVARVSIYNLMRVPFFAIVTCVLMLELSERSIMLLCAMMEIVSAGAFLAMESQDKQDRPRETGWAPATLDERNPLPEEHVGLLDGAQGLLGSVGEEGLEDIPSWVDNEPQEF